MELVDMRDLGSRAFRRWGSSPHARTTTLDRAFPVKARSKVLFRHYLVNMKAFHITDGLHCPRLPSLPVLICSIAILSISCSNL